MKQIATFTLMALFCLCVQFQSFAQDKKFTEDRNLKPFNAIKCSGSFKVIIKKGDKESVHIESNLELDKIITEVEEENTLKLRLKEGNHRNTDITMVVTYTNLRAIHSSGSSDIKVESTLTADEFSLKLSGSGDVAAKFDVKKLDVHLSGSADMNLSGKAGTQDIHVSGSGDVDAADLQSEVATIHISGSGDVQVHATANLEASVSGSGSVKYKGNPQVQKFKASGSGKLEKM